MYNPLSPSEQHIIVEHGTEAPFSGEYDLFFEAGTFLCRRCNAPLFSSKANFDAGCGWPAFDANIANGIKRVTDADGHRTEIRCAHCDAHLGHVFEGEQFTDTNTRHCVNSLAIQFVPTGKKLPSILLPD